MIVIASLRLVRRMRRRTLPSKLAETRRAIVGGIVSWMACWDSNPTLDEIGSTETTALMR